MDEFQFSRISNFGKQKLVVIPWLTLSWSYIGELHWPLNFSYTSFSEYAGSSVADNQPPLDFHSHDRCLRGRSDLEGKNQTIAQVDKNKGHQINLLSRTAQIYTILVTWGLVKYQCIARDRFEEANVY